MKKKEWLDLLGWKETELEDLRFAGFSYIKQGHYAVALKFFETLALFSQDNVYDLQTLGALYLEVGNNPSALNYLEQAIKRNASHEPTLLNRAKALLLLGYTKQGLAQASRLASSSDPSIAQQAHALSIAYT